MIFREGKDIYAIRTIGNEINLDMTGAKLRERLVNTGFWLQEQIDRVLAMEIGDSTIRPAGIRISDGR